VNAAVGGGLSQPRWGIGRCAAGPPGPVGRVEVRRPRTGRDVSMSDQQGLQIRHAQRHDAAFDATVRIAPEHAGLIRFSPMSGAKDDAIPVSVVDVSMGGLGFLSEVFLPRKSTVVVRIEDPRGSGTALLEARLRVQRIRMTDRRPGYLIGAALEDDDPDTERQLTAMLDQLAGETGEQGEKRE